MDRNISEIDYLRAYDIKNRNDPTYKQLIKWHASAMKIIKTNEKSSEIIDFGCGTGSLTKELLNTEHIVYAMDKSDHALEILKEKCVGLEDKLHIYKILSEKPRFSDESIDGVNLMLVLQFLEQPEKYFKECYRVLKNNGVLAISWKNEEWIKGNVKEFYKTNTFEDFSESTLKARGLYNQIKPASDTMKFAKDKKYFGKSREYMFNEVKELLETAKFKIDGNNSRILHGIGPYILARKIH